MEVRSHRKIASYRSSVHIQERRRPRKRREGRSRDMRDDATEINPDLIAKPSVCAPSGSRRAPPRHRSGWGRPLFDCNKHPTVDSERTINRSADNRPVSDAGMQEGTASSSPLGSGHAPLTGGGHA